MACARRRVYNLAAQGFVAASFEQPVYTGEVSGLGAVRLLEAVRALGDGVRFYQASTSEMFGNSPQTPQTEQTPFLPASPYGAAKVYAHWSAVGYRHAHGLHASCGIAFNHESPLRGMEFVTQKAVRALVRISRGEQDHLRLGTLDARRDWGFAGDYVEGMWRMLQQQVPDDYVLATGESHSVREFVEAAAECLDLRLEWRGTGVNEVGADTRSGRVMVRLDSTLFRPSEVHHLVGDPAKARAALGWSARTNFAGLVGLMVEAELRRRSSEGREGPVGRNRVG